MSETEFLALAEAALTGIENALEQACNRSDLDVECSRSGNVLEIECIENGSKIIVNSQAPMQELWLAAKSGGFHYRYDGAQWRSSRDEGELLATLSEVISAQAGEPVNLQDYWG
ncbi:iron donor protein CyaY [Herbaspirillum sp. RTI4]|uniref:iron donor protein CyaY n=1 Tax=Herbaspirillum sp. RTI4 TaxID=3048640 RepID=UPI002AB33C9D|nr:iron donor protein CyaY [Herbaspirillum sp. RTI4]MDY7577132.1 iron donor protein CyaY [Herbaspirillum sp. RTI4]MEA9982874.1 iron donor protein CyaY [Herbaspirillum sp. RTI4]